jgi:ParB family chromosome partitioning protein
VVRSDPGHIRKNPGDVSGLKYTISDVGLLQPIIVRRSGDFYTVIDGERRLRAMKELAVSELILGREVIIDVEETDADARFKQVIANIQREDIDPIDLGHAFVMLKEKYGYQYNEIAEIIGKTPHYVTSKVGLVKRLAPDVLEMVTWDIEASKYIPDISSNDEAEAPEVNLKIIEDIARLPEELQKNAYLTIRSKEMPTYEALKYLRSIKKGFTGGPDKKGGPTRALSPEDKPGDNLARYIEKLDRDVDELAGRIQTTVQLNRPEVIQKIEATLEKLSSLYVRLKNEAADSSQPGQAGSHDLTIYGKQECINVRYS